MTPERYHHTPDSESAAEAAARALEPCRTVQLRPPDLLCVCERARSFTLADPETRPSIASPEAAAELLVPLLRGLDREHCAMLALDTKHRLIALTTVSAGTADHTFMAPREVFRDALAHGASAILLGHNHPSGEARPSPDDRAVSRRLVQAGITLGIPVLDHLVIGNPGWTSLAREGAM